MEKIDMTLSPKGYLPRLIDTRIHEGIEDFGAVCIQGPKYCGKTWSGLNSANSVFSLMLPDGSDENLQVASLTPNLALNGLHPRLVDEWQELPSLWDAVRIRVDMSAKEDTYILTGSSTPKKSRKPKHSGIGRIEKIKMRTMSLAESQDSIGSVSLQDLFKGEKPQANAPTTDLELLAHLIIRGGWPGIMGVTPSRANRLAHSYIEELTNDETEDGRSKRDSEKFKRLLKSLARNVAQAPASKTIIRDMTADDEGNVLSPITVDEYLDDLKRLFVLEEIPAWSPHIRSSLRINKKPKYHYVDPSLPAALLEVSYEKLIGDLETFGFLFESLCMRDLLIYAEAMDAKVSYYRDREGFEIDAIVHSSDGHWAAFEVKLGHNQVDKAATNLLKITEKLVTAGAEKPAFCAVIEGLGDFAYVRGDGVYVIPVRVLGL